MSELLASRADVSAAVSSAGGSPPRVRLVREGLWLEHEQRCLPLYAASIHYWRHPVDAWAPCLRAIQSLGFGLIDTYIPWGVHETAPGEFDFGESDPRLNLVRFLRLAHELGLAAIVRPGPHINGELTFFGIPKRVIWNPDCQARSASGSPVLLPMLPIAFPVPSYASEVFHQETARYFRAVAPRLTPLLYPQGPIVMVQIDNEGAFYFRDGAYDQDYHPDALAHYRRFLLTKYGSEAALGQVYGTPGQTIDQLRPPERFDATTADELVRHLDWVEFHEELLATSFGRMAAELVNAGVRGVPTSHNLPFGNETTPLNPARLGKNVDLIALDYYHKAGPLDRAVIARRTTELVTRCEGCGHPAFAAEMGAGFPPFFPPLDENDSVFTLLCALAYGLRGFNLYMAVERDRWIGAPIDARGVRRPFADRYQRLCAALHDLRFPELRRSSPVRLVTPRSLRRLTRAMHAFGPATGALFAVLGAGAQERCLEDTLGLEGPVALEGDAFLRAFEQALDARGVPFAHVGGEDADLALDGARWVICASMGGMKPALLAHLRSRIRSGARVTLGPRAPLRDGAMQPLPAPPNLQGLELLLAEGDLVGIDPARASAVVANAIAELALPTYAVEPAGTYVTVHENQQGQARAVFVINPGGEDMKARVAVPGIVAARDVLEASMVSVQGGVLEARALPRSVRLLAVETAS